MGALRSPAGPEREPAALRYLVTYVREPERALEVELLRLREEAPRKFLFTLPGGVSEVRALGEDGSERALPVSEEGGVLAPPGTLRLLYRYELSAHGRDGHASFFTGLGEGDAWHVAGRAWLLRPHVVTPSLRAELVVQDTEALLPWAPDADGIYRLRGVDLVDSGFHGFGGRRCTVRPPGAVLEVAVLGRMSHVEDAALCAWVRQAAEEVMTVRRTFPYPRVTVRIVPVPRRDNPSLFGMVLWSSPPSVSLLVGQDATPGSFTRDWVAVHELLHLAHPIFLPRVSWLSEGLATYLTEVARARSGRQTPERAWEEILDGFARGRRAVGTRTMQDVIDQGDSYVGTYWTGALFALHLDVELRRVTGNRQGLEDVLERLARAGSTASLDDFAMAVDALAGRPLFRALLSRHLSAPSFSEQDALLQALGVESGPLGVQLGPARDSQVREALVGKRSEPAR
ncbi:hypothetical protein JRI60_18730 [Archangium violaceum]|uniref:hypothetical protein n=1 Tax=Archangium violaceum TaxID=83451 RepID=UPI0019522D43|nr:hypothetical protein [Archangium violaceum]QRO00918.1 hypothetical protein JRI60_18730 [Archangium violaceum]